MGRANFAAAADCILAINHRWICSNHRYFNQGGVCRHRHRTLSRSRSLKALQSPPRLPCRGTPSTAASLASTCFALRAVTLALELITLSVNVTILLPLRWMLSICARAFGGSLGSYADVQSCFWMTDHRVTCCRYWQGGLSSCTFIGSSN